MIVVEIMVDNIIIEGKDILIVTDKELEDEIDRS